jgi:hypothetical protein
MGAGATEYSGVTTPLTTEAIELKFGRKTSFIGAWAARRVARTWLSAGLATAEGLGATVLDDDIGTNPGRATAWVAGPLEPELTGAAPAAGNTIIAATTNTNARRPLPMYVMACHAPRSDV